MNPKYKPILVGLLSGAVGAVAMILILAVLASVFS